MCATSPSSWTATRAGRRPAGCPSSPGHREGAKALKQTVRHAVKHGVEELTVYAFSTENWTRPRDEVDGLMAMFAELIESETPELDEEGVRMTFIGRRDEVSRRAAGEDGLGRGEDARRTTG